MSIKRHTIYNLTGSLLPTAVNLITVPLYLHKIGEARYGVLAIVWLLLGCFSFFDLGLSRATSNRIANQRNEPAAARERTFWTAIGLNASFGILGGIILYGAAGIILGHFFKMPPELREEALSTLPWIASIVPLVTITGVLTGTLEGREQFGILNIVEVVGAMLFSMAPLLVAYHYGPDLRLLIPASILARAVSTVPLWIAVGKTLPIRGSAGFSPGLAKNLLSYGGWVTVNSALIPLAYSFDSFVIGSVINAAALPAYTIPNQIFNRLQVVPTALNRTLFPKFSSQSPADAQSLAVQAVTSLAALSVPIFALATLILFPFMVVWVGPDLALKSRPVGEIVAIGAWMSSLAYVPFALIQGQGRPRAGALLHIVEMPFLLGAVWLGVHQAGIAGAAWAMTIRNGVDGLSFLILAGMLRQVAKRLLVSGAWIFAVLVVNHLIGTSISLHVIASAIFVAISCLWVIRVEPTARNIVTAFGSLIGRKSAKAVLQGTPEETF
jgi:O-antigen/teichoic acid export membrane protein